MISKEEVKNISDRIFSLTDADEGEIVFSGGKVALTRFSEDRIHQNVAENRVWLTFRAVYGRKTAKVSTNKIDNDSLIELAEETKKTALNTPDNLDFLPVPEPQSYKEVSSFDESTAYMEPKDRAKIVEDVMSLCKKRKLHAFGFFSNSIGNARSQEDFKQFAVTNSKGLFSYYIASRGNLSVTVKNQYGSGWAQANSPRLSEITAKDVISRAAGNILQSKKRRDIKPGKYTVLLSSQAISNLMIFLLNSFNGMAVDEGRSIFQGQLGKQIMSDKITIRDDPYHPLHHGIPFDYEGMPRKAITLVENGILKNFVYDRRTALTHNVESTGHSQPIPNQIGAFPDHVVIDGSENRPDDLIKSTEHGILINRIWYVRFIDPFNVSVTGLTRDGTYLIEDGEIKGATRDFRFNQNLTEMFNNVEMLSIVRKTGIFVTPAIKIRDFNLSSYSGINE
jgi:PmbA protein